MSLLKKIQVDAAVENLIAAFMRDNNVSAAQMEDALNKVIITLKNQVMIDYLLEIQKEDSGGDD